MAKTTPTFDGFPKELLRFFGSLEKNNNKAWFDAHRKNYEAYFLEPAKQFVEAMQTPLAKISENIAAEPKINGSIKRINKDTRFSKDKAPYKDHLHLTFWFDGKKLKMPPAFHFRISAKEFGFGGGCYMFDPLALKKFQKAAADEKKGKQLHQAIQKTLAKGMELGGEKYKKVPRGFDPEHPYAELLKHKGLFVFKSGQPPAELFDKKAVTYCTKIIKDFLPVYSWLVEHTV